MCSLSCVLLTVLEPTEAEFTLFQEGQRNSEKSQRSQLDLCVVIFRTRSPANPEVGRLVEHSKRQVREKKYINIKILMKLFQFESFFFFFLQRFEDLLVVIRCWKGIFIYLFV